MAAGPLTGGCLCGGVRWELTTPPLAASYCHCTRCQRRTGTAASAQARVAPGSVRITAGEDLIRSWHPPDGSPKSFCSRCGGALWSSDPVTGAIAGVRLGTFDNDPGVRPTYRQYVDYAAVWEPLPEDGLPRYPELRPPEPR
ncbi:MAG: GFA family protein [Gaiellaceae bacterium]